MPCGTTPSCLLLTVKEKKKNHLLRHLYRYHKLVTSVRVQMMCAVEAAAAALYKGDFCHIIFPFSSHCGPPFPPPPLADYLPLLVHVESQKHTTCSSGSCVFSRPFCPCHCCVPPSPSGQRAALHCFFVLVLFISLGCKEPSFLFGVCGGDIFCSTRVHVYHLFAGLALWPPF